MQRSGRGLNLPRVPRPARVEAAPPELPVPQGVLARMAKQHRYQALCLRHVAHPNHHRTHTVQRITKRPQMAHRLCALEVLTADSNSLIWEALDPQNAPQRRPHRDPMVEMKMIFARWRDGLHGSLQRPLRMIARTDMIAQKLM